MVKRKQKSTKKITLQSNQDPSTPQSINKRNKPGRKRTQSEIQPLPSSVTNDSLNSKPTEVYTSTAVTNEELKEFIKESSCHGINNLELKMDGSEAASSDNHFKLEEVPTFYPTEEEFNNMGELIGALTLKAGRYGMCKVVPPANFKVNFGIEVEVC
ncbi:hypothetical protein K502DRAFT_126275 [Neoconidiobolus thromboides FSU 785]|nr:hypothetical protein K502DRAFT_126275 [Neoconidiobolus thromboides FSU 785]